MFYTHGMYGTKEYETWDHMIQRCTNPRNQAYQNYGGRGITVCDHWLKFENFFKDMGKRPDSLSLDRINNDIGYCPKNCRWATRVEQQRNRRPSKNNITGVLGVSWSKKYKHYQVKIKANGKSFHIGSFHNLNDAKEARKQAELKHWG